jgi:hypothetical protein
MTKKVIPAMGCLALLATFSGAALADSITITYSVTTATVGTIANKTGSPSLTGGPVGGQIDVKDTNTGLTLVLPAGSTGMIQSDNNISYAAGSSLLSASYAGSGAIQVEILSSYCPGGICLSGTNNFGTYTAAKGDGGGWGGVFDVTYLSPAILAFFGDSTDLVDPNGGTAFTTHNNTWRAGGTASSAQFGSGTITLQTTPVPEPGTLALIGTGFLGLGHLLRRKLT